MGGGALVAARGSGPLEAAWFAWAGFDSATHRARRADLLDLARRLGHADPSELARAGLSAALQLVAEGPAGAARTVAWWRAELEHERKAAETVARRVSTARSWIRWLCEQPEIALGWRLEAPRPKVRHYGKRRAAAWDLVLARIAEGPPHVAAVLSGLAFLLQRRGALLGAQCEDVDLEAATLRVRVKGGAELLVSLPDRVVACWRDYEAASGVRKQGGPYFRAASGRPLSERGLVEICASRGLKSPHRIRHAAAGELRRRGADPWAIQSALGHASIDTTQAYLASLDDLAGLCARVLAGEARFPSHTPHPEPGAATSWPTPPPTPPPSPGSSQPETAPAASRTSVRSMW